MKRVKKIRKKQFVGCVFDLRIEGDHTYNVSDCIVHNSGAGSLVLYSLGITTIDPIKYGLLFERFLSEARSPDLVLDYFCE